MGGRLLLSTLQPLSDTKEPLRGEGVQGAYLPWGVESNYTPVELLLNSRSDDSHSGSAEMKEENSL